MSRNIKQLREAAKNLNLARKIDKYMERWKSDTSTTGHDKSVIMQLNEEYNFDDKIPNIVEVEESDTLVSELTQED